MADGASPINWLGTAWHGCWFDGAWREGAEQITVTEPATGETLAVVGTVPPSEIAAIAARALEAQRAWGATPAAERAKLMRRAAAVAEAHAAEIAPWVVRESGSAAMKGGMESRSPVEEFHLAAALLIQSDGLTLNSPDPARTSFMRRVPLGVVAVITPWNAPLALAMRSVAPALALGNAVILKPDVQTPVCGGVVIARILEEAGLPPGLFTMIPGGAEVGEALVTAPAVRMVSFTGSTRAGRRVGALAGEHVKRVSLELGGNGAMLVLDDADVEAAASCGAFGSYVHQGQICMATGRHIVDRKVADRYVEALAAKAARLTVGDTRDPTMRIGPLINQRQFDRVKDIVSASVEQGATLVTGGPGKGLFFKPTVLSNVTAAMPAFSQEIFGPVAPVIVAEDEAHAIALANDTDYGLSAAVQTGSLDRGLRVAAQLRAAMVHVNDQTISDNAQAPIGGMGASGNGSRFSCLTSWDEFTEWRWTTASATPPRYPF